MGKLTVIKRGLYTSIQDLGRYGFRKYGVPLSGAMDRRCSQLANQIVNNAPNAPVIEITQVGPELIFHDHAIIAITGAELSPMVNQVSVANNKPLTIKPNDILGFGDPKEGLRAYLAIQGLGAESVLGSYSQFDGVTKSKYLNTRDELFFTSIISKTIPNARVRSPLNTSDTLEVSEGPEIGLIPSALRKKLLSSRLIIKENSRMGYQVKSPIDLSHQHAITSVPVVPGTVQLTPSGLLIIVMRDGQVTGGYPRIFQLSEESINILAQKSTDEEINFRLA